MNIKLTVQGNIWISNNSRLIMVTIYCNQYRSMVCLNMMFLKQDEIVKKKKLEKRWQEAKKNLLSQYRLQPGKLKQST